MSEWKEYRLEEVTEPAKEIYNPNGSNDFAYIGLEHIEQETLRLNSVGVSSDVTSNKFKFKSNDVLFGKLRPYFRKVVQPKFDGICSTDIWVLRAKKNFDQNYLFYFIANWDFVNTANSGEGGTRMPRADWNFLRQTVWQFPCFQEQTAIAEVLSSLDDKIDLLHRQNKTLEQLAETLFRQWFVEEAEESWEIKSLKEIGNVVTGKTPSTTIAEYWGDDVPFITPTDFKDHKKYFSDSARRLSNSGVNSIRKSFIPEGAIMVTCIGSDMGKVAVTLVPAVTNQQINSLVLNESFSYTEYVCQFLKSSYQLLRSMASSGSTMPILNKGDFEKIEIPIPPKNLLIEFENTSAELNKKIITNTTQIRTLTQLRDTLLPKLMSGEVRVNYK